MTIAQQVSARLNGTCKSLHEILEDIGQEELSNNSEFCAELDSLIFCCECCGWWYDIDEMKSDWICESCV